MTLLPEGFGDLLPAEARLRRLLQDTLLQIFARSGYVEVSPPLFEFSDDFDVAVTGGNAQKKYQNFHTIDPLTNRTLAFRHDMTLQIARIARMALKETPRPLRLCYGGEVARMNGSLLRSNRQYTQIGCELIGNNSIQAEAETLHLAVKSFASLGIKDIHIDIALVNMPKMLSNWFGFDHEKAAHLHEIFTKRMLDQATEITQDKNQQEILLALLKQSGDLKQVVDYFKKFTFPEEIQHYFDRLQTLSQLLTHDQLPAEFHIDFAETRGFAYQKGWAYAFYSKSSPLPLGRGGVYQLPKTGEDAVGFTLYLDSIGALLQAPKQSAKILTAGDLSEIECDKYRNQGYIVFSTLTPIDKQERLQTEAKRLNTDYYHWGDKIHEVK